jgi:hypothetical protein
LCYKDASGVLQKCSRRVAGVLQECCRSVAGVFQACSRGVAGMFQGCCNGVIVPPHPRLARGPALDTCTFWCFVVLCALQCCVLLSYAA